MSKSEDHAADAMDEIARRRRGNDLARHRASVDQSAARLREFLANNPALCELVARDAANIDTIRVIKPVESGWQAANTATWELIALLALQKLAELEIAIEETTHGR
jgi:hypothetical protein